MQKGCSVASRGYWTARKIIRLAELGHGIEEVNIADHQRAGKYSTDLHDTQKGQSNAHASVYTLTVVSLSEIIRF